MAGEAALSHEELLCRLRSLAERAVRRYALPAAVTLQLINLSENATYRVDDSATGSKWALRVHRDGYHSRTAIASELQWQMALKAAGAAITPTPIRGNDGEFIQTVAHEGLPRPRNVVLFVWEEGQEPAATDAAGFETLGEIAARMHAHVRTWQRPSWFERHTWDFETSLGERPHWGRWQDGMGITARGPRNDRRDGPAHRTASWPVRQDARPVQSHPRRHASRQSAHGPRHDQGHRLRRLRLFLVPL